VIARRPDAIREGSAHLPAAAAAALAAPAAPVSSVVPAAGIPFAVDAWGEPAAPDVLLVHGLTASARIWWRIGPGLAALGWHVTAVDLPGHGRTGHWTGHHRFRDAASDLAAFLRAARLAGPDLRVVGHSWGAMTAAWLPDVGVVPRTLVLLDPPGATHADLVALAEQADPPIAGRAQAVAAAAAANPGWHRGDVVAYVEAVNQVDVEAARAIALDNGDWDAGLGALQAPAAASVDTWVVRGDPAAGSLVSNADADRLAARIGAEHVLTIAGGPHSPQRTHPAATLAALARALGAPTRAGGPSRPADRA
jgi:pimeloyl-ACP methyl ester carboxylesterase